MSRILIADDNAEIRQLVGGILAEEGHKVTVAADGVKAVEVMQTDPPEVLILDIMMPNLDGYGVLREMSAHGFIERTKILVLTAKTSEADWVRGYKLGADLYLTKPFGSEEILEAVVTLTNTSKETLRERNEKELDKAQLLSRLESIFQEF